MDECEVKKFSKSDFIDKLKEFTNIILSKTDTLDLLYDVEQEDKFFKDEITFDILIDENNVDYFYKNLDQMHYIVDMCCLLYIKKQNDASSSHSPFSFYSFDEMQEYYYNLKFLFNSIRNKNLPEYFELIIEWIVLRGEEVDNYNIFINKQIEKVNQMHLNTFVNELRQQTEEFQSNVNKSLEDAKTNISSVETALQKKISTAIETIETTQKDELHKAEKNMMQTSIEILGVFAAVVLTFNMGISFGAEALEKFMQSGTYHSTLVILLFGFIIGNVIFALFAFLRYIHNKTPEKNTIPAGNTEEKLCKTIIGKIVIGFNVVLILLFVANFIGWHCNSNNDETTEPCSTCVCEQCISQTSETTTLDTFVEETT